MIFVRRKFFVYISLVFQIVINNCIYKYFFYFQVCSFEKSKFRHFQYAIKCSSFCLAKILSKEKLQFNLSNVVRSQPCEGKKKLEPINVLKALPSSRFKQMSERSFRETLNHLKISLKDICWISSRLLARPGSVLAKSPITMVPKD